MNKNEKPLSPPTAEEKRYREKKGGEEFSKKWN